MSDINFLDKNLGHLFQAKDSFLVAKSFKGEIYRKYENRVTKKFMNEGRSYFIKFHGPVGWKEILKNILQIKIPVIGARREYEALSHLDECGINCPQVKGFASRGFNPANSSSFLITEELYGTISLEDFFLEGLHKKLTFNQKNKLLRAAASIIREMHLSGLNHRDLYLCHLHVNKEIDFNNIQIYLIDLHRAQLRSKVPHRWIVKDLGGFIHSILQFDLSERDFYRFMMTYYDCTFREFCSNHSKTTKEILSRAFSMYLKPNLKVFIKNSSLTSEDSNFIKHISNSSRYLSSKDIDTKQFLSFFRDENSLIKSGEIIKNEKGHLITKTKIQGRSFYIKKYRIKGPLHFFLRMFKKTRAHNSFLSTYWMNAAGIRTAKPVLLYEGSGVLGARDSFFITEEVRGKRLDHALEEDLDQLRLIGQIEAFFKRMEWIQFTHGDAKSSNFFLDHNGLIAFDLDSSKRQLNGYFFSKNIKKDKERILKSLKEHGSLYEVLSRRIKGN